MKKKKTIYVRDFFVFFFYFLFSSFHYFFFWFCRTYFQKYLCLIQFSVFSYNFFSSFISFTFIYVIFGDIYDMCSPVHQSVFFINVVVCMYIYILNDVWFWEDKNLVFFMNSSLDHPFCMSNWSFFDRLCVWLIFLLASLYSIHCCLAAAYI